MSYDDLLYEQNGQRVDLILNRPDRLNALTMQSWEELHDALRTADDNQQTRVVVLSGKDRAFSSGSDVNELAFESVVEGRKFAKHTARCAFKIEQIETPVIAKVDGIAHGGGCELAAIADVTIASEDSSFRLPETQLNDFPGIAGIRLPDLIGLKQARELILTGRELSAQEALEVGLVNEVVEGEKLEPTVQKRVEQITAAGPMATKVTKRNLNRKLEGKEVAINTQSFLFSMEDTSEAIEAFGEDREPDWGVQ